MWTKSVILLLGLIAGYNAQILVFEMTCDFAMSVVLEVEGYTCTLSDLEYDFSTPFYFIRIRGEHLGNLTNADVRNVRLTNSRMNRIPANIFNNFPNAEALEVIDCYGLTFIPPDFLFAGNLKDARFVNNQIPVIGISSFVFATGLELLNLDNNRINALTPTSFVGLTNLRHLSLANNNIRIITPRMLAPLVNLEIFVAPDNQLEVLDGRLFINNPRLITAMLVGNNINAIGSSFLNINENLRFLFMTRNNCVNRDFVDGDTTLTNIRNNLEECFRNSPFGTQITLNVVGRLTIFDETDNVLVTVDWFSTEWTVIKA